ncbi:hypothetical protein TNCV_2904471 [Trichonephila clavipes]|nr:hypothetical protein TNCV_2904471 [Trichonephila clavipes]
MGILKLNKAKTSLKGSITRIATFMNNVSEHVDITELVVKLKKIDQLQRKIELKELLFGLETAKPTEEAEFEEYLYKYMKHVWTIWRTVGLTSVKRLVSLAAEFSSDCLQGTVVLSGIESVINK